MIIIILFFMKYYTNNFHCSFNSYSIYLINKNRMIFFYNFNLGNNAYRLSMHEGFDR